MIESRYILPALIPACTHLLLLFSYPATAPVIGHPSATPTIEMREPPLEPIVPAVPLPGTPNDVTVGCGVTSEPPTLPEDALHPDSSQFGVELDIRPAAVAVIAQLLPIGPVGIRADKTGAPLPSAGIFPSRMLDRPPRAIVQQPPAYPANYRQAGIEGWVLVEFTVDTVGQVMSVRILKASHAEFGESAARAIRRWRFEPGRYQGRPVRFQMSVPVEYNFNST